MLVYIDGQFYDEKDAKVSVFDHGLLYGDGVFEGVRAYNGRVFKLSEHIKRLYDSAKAIMLKVLISESEMIESVLEALRKNNLKDGYIRILITRGEGSLGIDPITCARSSVIIIADSLNLYPEEFYETGLAIISASVRRNSPDVVNPKIKSLNYINNIMAKIEARQAGVLEAIMLDRNGYVCECTGDNIFIVKNGVIKTPPVYLGVLKGITRDFVIEIARDLGYIFQEEIMTQYDIYTADECFLTGTAAEAIPVVMADSREISNGNVGEVTKSIIKEFRLRVAQEGWEI
ncbi:MAG: branched-chain-amino-acid transaminase [bacterium]|nr:branched-chain-amino-acid transaminase [bacterium]